MSCKKFDVRSCDVDGVGHRDMCTHPCGSVVAHGGLCCLTGAIVSVCLGALLLTTVTQRSNVWQLAHQASSGIAPANALPQPMKHSSQQPASDLAHHPRQPDSRAEAAKLPAAPSARQSGAGSTTPSGLHDGSAAQQAQRQQQAAPMGQTVGLPAGRGLDRLRLEGRFSVDRHHGELTFEWPLSTIRWVSAAAAAAKPC